MDDVRAASEKLTGRDLDTEVSRAVFGITGIRTITVIDHKGLRSEPGTVSKPYRMADGRTGRQAKQIPHYSADWAGLGLVVDEMRRKGFYYDLGSSESARDPAHAACFFRSNEEGVLHRGDSMDDSLPVAVCRAALLALASVK